MFCPTKELCGVHLVRQNIGKATSSANTSSPELYNQDLKNGLIQAAPISFKTILFLFTNIFYNMPNNRLSNISNRADKHECQRHGRWHNTSIPYICNFVILYFCILSFCPSYSLIVHLNSVEFVWVPSESCLLSFRIFVFLSLRRQA